MSKFVVKNLTSNALEVGIEPWAGVVQLPPGGKAEFEYSEPAEVGIGLTDGGPVVGIMSDRVKVPANGSEEIFD